MRASGFALSAVLLAFGTVSSVTAADHKKIDTAIKKGGEYLRGVYDGKNLDRASYGIGPAALAGLAMMEAGIKPDDSAIKSVANGIRTVALTQTETYQLSLCILFLDRLGDPADVPTIQMLGVRLYAGLNANGGWGYHCWPDTNANEAARLQAALQKDSPGRPSAKKPEKKDDGFLKPSETSDKVTTKLHPEVASTLATVHQTIRTSGRGGGGYSQDDNSNTQFGIIGLWVAARNGLPAKDAFALIEARIIRSQNADGGWPYNASNGTTSNSTVAMTCAGLLGLAVGGAARDTTRLTGEKQEKKDTSEDDPFYNPKKGDGAQAEPAVKVKPLGGGQRERSADTGLRALGAFLASQAQARGLGGRIPSAGPGNGALGNFIGLGNALYTLWSLERVAVAYSLETIGGVDWYDWGSEIILGMQVENGSFNDTSYEADINTSFAILFLAKANFTKDLSAKNKGKDPGKVELRGGGGGQAPLTAPAPKDRGAANRGNGPPPPSSNPEEIPAMKGGFALPNVVQPTEAGEAENVSKGLTGATAEADWTAKLAEARDSKGGKWTRGLVLAAARLDGEKRRQARDALAERLTRMTTRTLREMLRDPEVELRRAACLACAMKDDKAYIPDLIERITDPSDFVVRAARAGLISFASGSDFGPKAGADEEAKVKAAADWSKWHDSQAQKK